MIFLQNSSVITHELTLHEDGDYNVTPSMKNLALKANKQEETSSENEDNDDEKDHFALITRGLAISIAILVQLRSSHFLGKFHSNALPLWEVILGNNENL